MVIHNFHSGKLYTSFLSHMHQTSLIKGICRLHSCRFSGRSDLRIGALGPPHNHHFFDKFITHSIELREFTDQITFPGIFAGRCNGKELGFSRLTANVSVRIASIRVISRATLHVYDITAKNSQCIDNGRLRQHLVPRLLVKPGDLLCMIRRRRSSRRFWPGFSFARTLPGRHFLKIFHDKAGPGAIQLREERLQLGLNLRVTKPLDMKSRR